MSKIIYCMITQNGLCEVRSNVEAALPYVDKVVVVDGGSIDGTIFYFRNWEKHEPKIHFIINPWPENFATQRNVYLRYVDTIASPGDFILVSDSDEHFEDRTLKNLRKLCNYLEGEGSQYNVLGFHSKDVTMQGPVLVNENESNYWKHLLYKWVPGMHYVMSIHESLVIPDKFNMVNVPFFYRHIKQDKVIWERGLRNVYHWGGGPGLGNKSLRWLELKDLVAKEYGSYIPWHAFQKKMLDGNLPTSIKNWLIAVKDETGYDGASEYRETYKTYFRIYHPEEEPEEFRGQPIE